MNLSYKNFATGEILEQHRNINYAQGEMLFGFSNTINLVLKLVLDPLHIIQQADVFAREILTHKSEFDLKRILGPYSPDWARLLHETYVYDRAKCIFYGLSSNNLMDFPNNLISFPGNIILANLLKHPSYQFYTDDAQPYSLYVNVNTSRDAVSVLEPLFERFPNIKSGLTDIPNVVSYVSYTHEAILRGLLNASKYLKSVNKSNSYKPLYELYSMDDEKISNILMPDSNPIFNSFMSEDFESFMFILPNGNSGPGAMRFNESLFIGRALGLTSDNIETSDNFYYKRVKRNYVGDFLAREEMYSVTGLKTEIVPYSEAQVREYLNINTVETIIKGGGNGSNPDLPL